MLYAIIGMIVVILDQLVKYWVDHNLVGGGVKDLIPGVISMVRVQNDGAAFSFLAGGGARIWFIVLTCIFTLMVIIALATNFISGRFGRWCLVLVTAGGLSNCLDRVLYGYVLDMFKLELFNFAVFNVADIFISLGCIAFIIYILFGGEKELEDDADEFDEPDEEEAIRPVRKKAEKPRRRPIPVEDEEDEDDEEDVPVRKTARPAIKKAEKPRRRFAVSEDEDEDEDDLPDVPKKAAAVKAPVRKAPPAAESKRVAPKYSEEEFEEFFAPKEKKTVEKKSFSLPQITRKAPVAPAAEPAERPAREVMPRKVRPVQESAPAFDPSDPFAEWDKASAKVSNKPSEPVKPAVQEVEEFVDRAADVVKPMASAVKETAPVAEPSFDEFDLDSILNEFK